MIDPNPVNGEWDRTHLEEWILFGICVCNKPGYATARKVDALLQDLREEFPKNTLLPPDTPFELVRHAISSTGTLMLFLQKHHTGQYRRIHKAFIEVVEKVKDPLSTTVAELESVSGIGPKTARMILLYFKPETNVVPLDTHVLKWLYKQGYDVPKGTPSAGKKYQELEQIFIHEAEMRGMTVKELDSAVWQSYAIKS